MAYRETAYFIHRPRRVSELDVIHILDLEKKFHVVREVKLGWIDFENFSEDMLVDRYFLEEEFDKFDENGAINCIMVRCKRVDYAILVVPNKGFVSDAAYLKL